MPVLNALNICCLEYVVLPWYCLLTPLMSPEDKEM